MRYLILTLVLVFGIAGSHDAWAALGGDMGGIGGIEGDCAQQYCGPGDPIYIDFCQGGNPAAPCDGCYCVSYGSGCLNQWQAEGCFCSEPDRQVWAGVGCVCSDGKYGDVGFGTCKTCPSGGTVGWGISGGTTIENCYTTLTIWDAAANGTVRKSCYWSTLSNDYSRCIIDSVVQCDVGYYRSNWLSMFCSPVEPEYYSPANDLNRYPCDTYTNSSGTVVSSVTTGSGPGAGAKTDCKIVESDRWTDESGTYGYSDCFYTG